ncbi:DNA topoisomerase [Breznakia pachnodae]|uniref:DNA topoisomerase n=1 Tax=Breznakia pachnodae TaxID=265178 RepID=A0ABU0E3S4_9FIRM|nr:DNA topoisomerase [Breznakia pachnodae]MDQ0361542.1 DNA topoisomerase-3 [Breznakia pachnodae]
MKLVIAEKPALAKDIANAILDRKEERNDVIYGNDYAIVSAYGHLLTLADPQVYDEKYKTWNINDLPIYFENWKRVPDNEGYKRKRLALIGKLLKESDEVIHAGDPDDEGQLLIDEILDYFSYKGKVYRVLINDNIPENIKKEFQVLKDNQEFRKLGLAAYARQMADLAFGINETRLASLKLGLSNISTGRVQTPTLGLVVSRDRAIENHEKQRYYELMLKMNLTSNSNSYSDVIAKFKFNKENDTEQLVTDKSFYSDIINGLTDFKGEVEVTNKPKKNAPPLPYNLTKLQSDMNKKYGYGIKQTLDITQSLRDKYKAITYNRSDCQYLSDEFYEKAPGVLAVALSNVNSSLPLDYSIKSKCFSSENVSAHHAIIPQNIKLDISKFTEAERNVYVAIVERYAMQFLPTEKIEESEFKLPYKTGVFVYKESRVVDSGYKKYFSNKSDQENHEIFVEEGIYDFASKDYEIIEKETKPLKRYTPASLNSDLSSIAKYVSDEKIRNILKEKDKGVKGENGSIGTVATRGAIIELLLKRKFLEMKGNSIISTTLGREFYDLLPDGIKTADLTALWWLIQEDIKNGTRDVNDLQKSVVNEFRSHMDSAYKNVSITASKPNKIIVGKCPLCGSNVIEGKTTWYCEKYSKDDSGCDFRLFENVKYFDNTLKLTSNKVTQLLAGKSVEFNIKSKLGKKYPAEFELVLNGKYANLRKI